MADRNLNINMAALDKPRAWLITGAAGFIGSHLVEELLRRDQFVVGLDNFSTGRRENLNQVRAAVGESKWQRFNLVEGDIRSRKDCDRAIHGCDHVLHQAALASVIRSVERPEETYAVNADGFANVFFSASRERVRSFVYASTSAVYGDDPALLKVEENTGNPLSPYAASKAMNEKMAEAYSASCRMKAVGLRYFNVYGPRQVANGPYSAVIPLWIHALQYGNPQVIYGDGSSTRDYCYVQDVARANLLSALANLGEGDPSVFNVASGVAVNLRELSATLRSIYSARYGLVGELPVSTYSALRTGEIVHSRADITRARRYLSFAPQTTLAQGIENILAWSKPAPIPVASFSHS